MKQVLIKLFLLAVMAAGTVFSAPQAAAQTAFQDSLCQVLVYYRQPGVKGPLRQAAEEVYAIAASGHLDAVHSKKLLQLDSLIYKTGSTASQPALSYAGAVVQLLQGVQPAYRHPDYAIGLTYLAALYVDANQAKKALPLCQQALEILKNAPGEAQADYARALFVLGQYYKRLRQFDKALPFFEQSLAVRKSTLGESHADYSASLYALGLLYMKMGQYEKALPRLQQALVVCKRSLGAEHPDYACILKEMGDLYKNTGQFDKALPLYKQALAIRKKVRGEVHAEYSGSLYTLGLLYADVGQYEKALPLLQQALEVCRKTLGEEDADYANILKSLGFLYQGMGQYQKALQLYEQAFAIRKKVLGPEHPTYSTILKNLALLHKDMGQYEKALPLLQQAVESSKKSQGENHPSHARMLKHLASLYTDMGKYDEAFPLYQQVLTIYRRTYGEEHPYAASMSSLASMYMKQGEYNKAQPLFEQALGIIKKSLGKNTPGYAYTLKNLALLYTLLGKSTEAAALFTQVSDITLGHLRKTYTALSEQEKMVFLNKEADQFCYLPSLLYSGLQNDPSVLRQVYENELVLKGMVLEDQQQVLHAIRKSGDTAALQLFDEWRFNKSSIGKQLLLPKAERVLYLDSLQEVTNQLEQALSRRAASFHNLQRNQAITPADIAKKLSRGEAAVEFIRFRLYNRKMTDSVLYAALVLRPGDSTASFVPLFEEKQLLQLLKSSMSAKTLYSQYAATQKLYGKWAGNAPDGLYQLIWKPLEKHLAGVQTVYYAPAGLLHRVAFQALRKDAAHSLIDSYRLRQVLSTRSVVLPATRVQKPASVALWGNIDYNNTGSLSQATYTASPIPLVQADTLAALLPFYTAGSRGGGDEDFCVLHGAKEEMDSLGRLLLHAGIPITTDSGTVATEEAFKALSGHSPQVLHLATHGFFLPVEESLPNGYDELQGGGGTLTTQQNPMFRSGLVLAGANHAWKGKASLPGREDGILTAYEIAQLDLSGTEVVVLSACETALGELQGNEGVIGLQRAFKLAGVNQLVMSLWRVPDKETMSLMTLFYRNWLNGQSAREALRSAQLKMKELYPPYYWAAFVVVE